MSVKKTTGEIQAIIKLSHEFGTPDYVKGGGGNTSVKDESTLWIKPSGTTLGGLTAEKLVELDRSKLAAFYGMDAPSDVQQREAFVKDKMMAAVRKGSQGRPSVETPLHDSFSATFVVHTHTTLVNGMTCGCRGEEACRELFPDALWIPYADPGYVLSLKVHAEIESYRTEHGREPAVVFLENHGLVVAGNTAEEIRSLHSMIMDRMRQVYRDNNIDTELVLGEEPASEASNVVSLVAESIPALQGSSVKVSGKFSVPEGPISPDHIVYSKAYPLKDEPCLESFAYFKRRHGYYPQVVEWDQGVFGIGATEQKAALALELAQDGALIEQLALAFGGVRYLGDEARDFIDNWEVEAFRRDVKI